MLEFLIPFLVAISYTMAAPPETTDFSKSISQFSVDLYQKCAESSTGNIILSPYSVAVALALASEGANGVTFDEIKRGLHLSGDKAAIAELFSESSSSLTRNVGNSTLNIANKVYVQLGKTIKKEFNDVAVQKFHSEAQTLNFAQNVESANTINAWVEEKTNKKIKDLIASDSLDADTRLVLVNAIYFKGTWKNQFDKTRTAPGPFYISEDKTVDVDYMHTKEYFKYGTLEDLDASALELKYAGSDISFLIILPNKRTGLAALEAQLKNVDLSKINERLYEQEVEVTIPKFKVEYKIELTEVLKKLGLNQLFSDDADFSGLLDSNEPLKVSEVIHKAFIDVNEEGAEAAAATAGISRRKRSLPTLFEADHPFIYAIVSHTNLMAFFCGSLRLLTPSITIEHDEL